MPISMDPQKQFTAEVKAFLKASGMPPTVFGKLAVGDAMFVSDLEKGRAPGLRVAARARAFMQEREAQLQ